ncbi:hypothetical protein MRB53_029354 [Persea americana]|uniref:Uncharacterized protein n=1 Tax=Persea americana TaxID=3435 RepID=A0ACC2KI41_PERAE|nr:hypothetical protein MRB53_029354 [Persea americana]|eukprot:TRINITY_DN11769_c0_g2_i1.p1 TRINITY_DN11769_c0_g2~~TRINITY_DN11769_c0_g2_i1.p1  ORF type:complete len:268 (+),score=45.15 TRINITY_DN11769_c0_g2_i1:196-999(+)
MSEKKLMSVKLLVDKSSHKVLFAEAGKDFVDLLFSLLGLPLGSAIGLLTDKSSIDVSISKLRRSVDNLSEAYIRSGLTKISLLNLVTPSLSTTSSSSSQTPPLLLLSSSSDAKTAAKKKRYYTCSTGSNHGEASYLRFPSGQNQGYMYTDPIRGYISDVKGSTCPRCSQAMVYEIGYVAPPSADGKAVQSMEEKGFVKGGTATYMVTDDLEVMPMSTISSIALLTKFKVRDVGAFEEKVVEVGMEEVLSLLKASLQSKTALTDTFLK